MTTEHYRIKPEPTFQLPQPPPAMQWHRTDGWQESDLPQGMRPLVKGEARFIGDELKDEEWSDVEAGDLSGNTREIHCHSRTARPLTFTHAGKQWTWHRPGDPMPCDKDKRIYYLMVGDADCAPRSSTSVACASDLRWNQENLAGDIIGWRYAGEKKTVPLGPEDVPPGSEFRFNSSLPGVSWTRLGVNVNGVILYTPGQELNCKKNIQRTISWNEMSDMQINRSLPLTGRWNPNAWEPCHKLISENG